MKKTELIAVRTSIETKKFLDQLAEEQDRSLSYIVNKIIELYIKEKGNRPK